MRIRVGKTADAATARALAEAAFAPYAERLGRPPAPMVADFEAAARDGALRIAETADGDALGYAILQPGAKALLIENLAVAPEARRRGVAAGLIAQAGAEARRRGLGALELYTNVIMETAQATYAALGFRETQRRREDGFERVYYEKTVPTA